MPHSPKELERIGEESSEHDQTFELEDTAVETEEPCPSQIPLKKALNMEAHEFSSKTASPCKLEPTPEIALDETHVRSPLPLTPPAAWKESLAARRRKMCSPSCSILCNENRTNFSALKWATPLGEMGNALSWRMSLLNHINAIQY